MFCYLLVTLPLLGVSSTLGGVPHNPDHESRITGGDTADIEDYPYNAAYEWTSEKEGNSGFCSGAIVHNYYVLTAAHCVYEIEDPSIITLRVGSSNRKNGRVVPVLEIIVHPDFLLVTALSSDYYKIKYSVAMLRTELITFDSYVQPASLPPATQTKIPEEVTVTGWGKPYPAATSWSTVMKVVDLDTMDPRTCQMYLISSDEWLFCAGGYRKGICAGDDGAPAVEEGTNMLQGIAMYQLGCGTYAAPAVFLDVWIPSTLDFIKATIRNETYETEHDHEH